MTRSPRRSRCAPAPSPRSLRPSHGRSPTIVRAVAVTLLCGLALLLGTAPALAHTRLASSDPADGATLANGPERVSLTFNETMQPGFATITVIGPDGGAYQTGEVTTTGGATASIAVAPLRPAGRYEIGYRVVSEDGHPVTGSVAFTLTVAGPVATAPSSAAAPQVTPGAVAEDETGGTPVWPWIVGAVVLVGGGVAAALRLGRG